MYASYSFIRYRNSPKPIIARIYRRNENSTTRYPPARIFNFFRLINRYFVNCSRVVGGEGGRGGRLYILSRNNIVHSKYWIRLFFCTRAGIQYYNTQNNGPDRGAYYLFAKETRWANALSSTKTFKGFFYNPRNRDLISALSLSPVTARGAHAEYLALRSPAPGTGKNVRKPRREIHDIGV